jgi:hypothetical protein
MANVSREMKAGKDVRVVTALRNGVLGLSQLALAGKVYTESEAADLVQGRIDARAKLLRAKADWEAAIKTYEAVDKLVDLAVRDLRNAVIGAHGEDSPKMAEFEFVPRKKPVYTQEQITATVAKRAATRLARGTKGRKQKLAITGVVSAAAPGAEAMGVASPAVLLAVAGAPAPAAHTAGSQTTASTQSVTVEGNAGPLVSPPQGESGSSSG